MPKAFRVPSNIRDNMLLMMNPQISCKTSKLISSFLKSFVIMVSLRQGIVFPQLAWFYKLRALLHNIGSYKSKSIASIAR